eukprot:symbB.v1.2.017598.t1/scaffold1362.1/size123397/5
MLLGVLVEAVKTVSTIEREHMMADFARRVLWQLIQSDKEDPDEDDYCDRMISEKEFRSLLRKPKAVKALSKLGVDPQNALDNGKLLFEDGGSVSFMDFMRAMLTLRGSNKTTVKDMVEMRKYLSEEFQQIRTLFGEMVSFIGDTFPQPVARSNSWASNHTLSEMDANSPALRGAHGVRRPDVKTARALHLAEQQSPEDAMAQALARSTLDFHAPIARSLGYDVLDTNPNVGLLPIPHCETLPNTLEHFGLLLRYPSEYRLVLDWFDQQCGFLDRILAHGTRVVQAALKGDRAFQSLASGYEVKSRIKSPQSLMKKLLQGRVVNDLLGLEIIVQPRHMISGKGEMSAFAAAAGILRYVSGVENGWRVAPNSFKDYVSQPKKSGYQAIHLTLVTDFEALTLSRGGRAPCQLELHIFTQEMKAQERQGPASHASYKAFPLRPEAIMEKLGDERGVVSITEVAHHDFSRPSDAQKMEDLAHRAGFEDMDLEDLRLSRAHVDEVVSAFQDLMAANRAEPALPVEP